MLEVFARLRVQELRGDDSNVSEGGTVFLIIYSRYSAREAGALAVMSKSSTALAPKRRLAPCKREPLATCRLFSRRKVNFVVALCSGTVTDSCFIYIFFPPSLEIKLMQSSKVVVAIFLPQCTWFS